MKIIIFTKFINSSNFKEKTRILFEYFDLNKKEENNKFVFKKGYLQFYYEINEGIIEKINNKYYFEYFPINKQCYLSYYDKKDDNIQYCNIQNLEDEIYSVSISKDSNQIYICLLNKKNVKIIDYNLDNEELIINKNEIIDETSQFNSHFNKCIKICDYFFATADAIRIIIWNKTNENSVISYKNIKISNMQTKTSDMILANNEYFITSQPLIKTITIFNIKSLSQEKYITNIDCIDSTNCFLLFKQYIIINCKQGIALLLIKTKQIVQYIETFNEFSGNKEIILDNKKYLYFK